MLSTNFTKKDMLLGLLKMIFKPAVKNTMKQLGEDKEFLQAIEDINESTKKIEETNKENLHLSLPLTCLKLSRSFDCPLLICYKSFYS